VLSPGLFVHQWNMPLKELPHVLYVSVSRDPLTLMQIKTSLERRCRSHCIRHCDDALESWDPTSLDANIRPDRHAHYVLVDMPDHSRDQCSLLHNMHIFHIFWLLTPAKAMDPLARRRQMP
jgi:hypothetical protein